MSKTIPAGLLAHMQGPARRLAWLAKVTRRDAAVYGFTTHDESIVYSGVTYQADLGLDVASLVSSSGFAVDNTEARMLADGVVFVKSDILAGRWDGAEVVLMRINPTDVASGAAVYMTATFGNVRPDLGFYSVELRGLRQYLQSNIVNVTQPTCRNRLGDARCGVNLGAGGLTVTGTLTHVTSQQVVRDSARAEAVDFFAAGELTMTSGDATGLTFKVRTHAADGTLTLALPSVQTLQVGDTYSLIAGCRRRLAEDCVARFSNAVNFNGEPHLPGQDQVVSGT